MLALVAMATLIAGCSSTPGTATPAPSAPASSAGPRFGAPPVPAPLDPAPLEKAPCAAMTSTQVASLGAAYKNEESKPSDPLGPTCSWSFDTDDNASSVTGGVFTKDPSHGGISGLYGRQQTGGLTKFEPFSVNGFPGVVYDASNNPLLGSCALGVGLRNDLSYTITVGLDDRSPFTDACELGKKVAGFVITYLQQGGH
jgi:hypothetical protein